MGLGGAVGHESAGVAVGVDSAARHAPTGRKDRHQRRLARRTLDDAAALFARGSETFGQAEELVHPVDHQGLDLGACR